MKKRAFVQDWVFFGIFMLIFMFSILFGGRILFGINDHYQNISNDGANMTWGKERMQSFTDRYTGVFDSVFMFVMVIFIMAIFISMFLMNSHPAIFFVVVVIFSFILIVLGIIGNIFDKVANDSPLSVDMANYTGMNFIAGNWLLIIVIFGFVSLILFFAKVRGSWFGQ